MKTTLNWRLAAMVPVGVLAVWIAASHDPANEPARFVPAVDAAPYVSPYPAPQIDASAPPQEAAPTF
jgi:hypothetical protein